MTDRDGEDQAFVDAISEWPDIDDGPPTLAGFLLARISETVAQVTDGAQGAAVSHDGWHTVDCGTGIGYWANGECTCRYVDRVLAECEAKRRIVERYAEHAEYDDEENSYEHATGRIVGLGEAVRLLAAPYADHPDYQEAWRP